MNKNNQTADEKSRLLAAFEKQSNLSEYLQSQIETIASRKPYDEKLMQLKLGSKIQVDRRRLNIAQKLLKIGVDVVSDNLPGAMAS